MSAWRILWLTLPWLASPLAVAETKPDVGVLLLANFSTQTPDTQKGVLRQVALVGSVEQIEELALIGLRDKYESDVRREALKAMLVLGGANRYRGLLKPLRQNIIDTYAVISAYVEINDPRLLPALIRLGADAALPKNMLRKAVLAVLSIWQEDVAVKLPWGLWRGGTAQKLLQEIGQDGTGTRQKRAEKVQRLLQGEQEKRAR